MLQMRQVVSYTLKSVFSLLLINDLVQRNVRCSQLNKKIAVVPDRGP